MLLLYKITVAATLGFVGSSSILHASASSASEQNVRRREQEWLSPWYFQSILNQESQEENLVQDRALPPLPNNLCNPDDIYDEIRTGNVVEHTLVVRWRECPSNKGSQPCGIALENHGFSYMNPGPMVDGVRSDTIAVNDDIPGPTIRANLGDTIRVTVVNLIGEPTSMHWHGITQFRTPWADGDVNINTCPIAAGFNYTYEFVAHPVGTTFYHSHEKSQRNAGMFGALIVEDPEEDSYPEHTVLYSDFFHQNPDTNFYFWGQNTPGGACITFGGSRFTGNLNPRRPELEVVGAVVGDGKVFQSFLVNGRGVYDYQATQIPRYIQQGTGNATAQTFEEMACPGQTDNPPQCEVCLNQENWSSEFCTTSSAESACGMLTVFEVRPGETSRLRLINGGSLFAGQVCVDAHEMTIITIDGSSVEPYTVDCVLLMPGERADVLIEPMDEIGDYWMRFTTAEQQVPSEFGNADDTPTFPHQGWAIVRVVNEPGDPLPNSFPYRPDMSPIACSGSVTTNCGPAYWNSAITYGCAAGPARDEPGRCRTIMDLVASSSPNDDTSLCHGMGYVMPHEVSPNRRLTTALGFIPDEVPRWEGNSLNTRIEVLTEEEWGYPYLTPQDPADWGTHAPLTFMSPERPLLSEPPEERELIYNDRAVIRPSNMANPGELPPNYPAGFSSITIGVSNYQLQYGDVVRVLMTCVEPYGPGCAMPHPMHLHGHKFAVMYSGYWDEEYDESMFVANPIYRDTVVANTDGWSVIQFAANNPGVWRFHCHVNIHHRSGMAFVFDTGGDEAVEAVRAPPPEYNNCVRYRGG